MASDECRKMLHCWARNRAGGIAIASPSWSTTTRKSASFCTKRMKGTGGASASPPSPSCSPPQRSSECDVGRPSSSPYWVGRLRAPHEIFLIISVSSLMWSCWGASWPLFGTRRVPSDEALGGVYMVLRYSCPWHPFSSLRIPPGTSCRTSKSSGRPCTNPTVTWRHSPASPSSGGSSRCSAPTLALPCSSGGCFGIRIFSIGLRSSGRICVVGTTNCN